MIFPNIKVQPYWLKTLEAADAPVALPKPVGWFHRHPNECKNGELCNYRIASGDRKDGWVEFPLYTGQQVRALLGGTQSTYKNEWEDIRTLPKTYH